jgi:hypothetical protein
MAEQPYGTSKDWLLCLAAISFMQTPSWHSSRWYKKHPEALGPVAELKPTDKPKKSGWHRLLDLVEQPLFLAIIGVIGGIVGVIVYTPIFLAGDAIALVALHRSGAVADKSRRVQLFWYCLLFVVMSAILLEVGVLLKSSTREFTDNIARAVASYIKPQMVKDQPTPARPNAQKRCDDVISQNQIFNYLSTPNGIKKNPNTELSECRLRYRPDQLTLFDLFNTDFSQPPYTYTSSYAMKISTGASLKTESLVDYVVVAQLSSASRFLSFYVWPTSEVFDVSVALSTKYQTALNDQWANMKVTGKAAPGDSEAASSEDVVFSKRVFIYYENYLTLEQILKIENAFKKQGLSVILRGSDYLENEKLQAKLARKN